MTTYAAYYNLVQGDKAARLSESRRGSQLSTSSNDSNTSHKSKFSLKHALESLKATEEVQTPTGIYGPIIKRGPLFSGLKPAEKAQEPTPIYAGLTHRDRPLFGLKKSSNKKQSSSLGSADLLRV